jgi:uncharacterized protein (DUF433 family)
MKIDTKRQNFNITPDQEAEIAALQQALGASTVKDAILRAVRIVNALRRELRGDRELCVRERNGSGHDGEITRFVVPELESAPVEEYKYLASRPDSWRKQLYVRGRRLRASNVHIAMLVNKMTPQEAADDWDLPLEAVEEIIRYCEANEPLITAEAEFEKRNLIEAGLDPDVRLGPKAA